eukprot:512697_1
MHLVEELAHLLSLQRQMLLEYGTKWLIINIVDLQMCLPLFQPLCQPLASIITQLNKDQKLMIIIVAIIDMIILFLCLTYLLKCTRQRSKEFGQLKISDFIKETGVGFKAGIILHPVDFITDCLYAGTLIDHNEILLGLLSLVFGTIGCALFAGHCMLPRKIYSKIPDLKLQSESTNDIAQRNDILNKIRSRKCDIDVFAMLIVCCEDIPQITTIYLVNTIQLTWNDSVISIVALGFSILSVFIKFIMIIYDKFGCNDDSTATTNVDPLSMDIFKMHPLM